MTPAPSPAHALPFPSSEAELDALLARPGAGVGTALAALGGDVLLLGAGGGTRPWPGWPAPPSTQRVPPPT
jgi:hypothetical protein